MCHKRHSLFALLSVLVFTFIVFSPCLKNDFVNWDDPGHFLFNSATQVLDLPHLKEIFSSFVIKTYIPLTILSFAIERFFFGFNATFFHLNNILFHLGVVSLVYVLALRLGFNIRVSAFAALVFGIHPMHVESVAWVTERKDLLYSLFYLLAACCYVRYLETGKHSSFGLSVFWGLLSMLAKPMAMSLPLVFFLFDGIYRRPWRQSFMTKIPYFLYIIPLTAITYVQHARIPFRHVGEAILIWIWTAGFYIRKFIFPEPLVPYYMLPQPVRLLNAPYLLAIVSFGMILFLLWHYRRMKWFVFAVGFYALSTFFLWRYDNFGESVVVDHYMYLPSLGFCLLFGIWVDRLLQAAAQKRFLLRMNIRLGIVFLIAILGVRTHEQCFVWRDSYSLWSQVIRYEPRASTAYNNRGAVQKNYQAAIADYSQAIAIDPHFWEAYFNRAKAYFRLQEYDRAIADLDRLLAAQPDDPEGFYLRGKAYAATGRRQAALEDFSKALEIVPACTIYQARAKVYDVLGQENLAAADRAQAKNSGCSY